MFVYVAILLLLICYGVHIWILTRLRSEKEIGPLVLINLLLLAAGLYFYAAH